MVVPWVVSEIGQKAFSYQGPAFWDEFSDDLKKQENKNTFKSAYIKNLLREVNHPIYVILL